VDHGWGERLDGGRLADDIVQGSAEGDEFRTAPLWGLGQRIFFMHDGRTRNLREAIELHAGAKPRVEWLLNDWYEVPWGCFVPARGEGLLFGGRCLSAEHEAVASARVTAQCFSYGHALGVAAALARRERLGVRDLDGRAIRDELNRQGARLDD